MRFYGIMGAIQIRRDLMFGFSIVIYILKRWMMNICMSVNYEAIEIMSFSWSFNSRILHIYYFILNVLSNSWRNNLRTSKLKKNRKLVSFQIFHKNFQKIIRKKRKKFLKKISFYILQILKKIIWNFFKFHFKIKGWKKNFFLNIYLKIVRNLFVTMFNNFIIKYLSMNLKKNKFLWL